MQCISADVCGKGKGTWRKRSGGLHRRLRILLMDTHTLRQNICKHEIFRACGGRRLSAHPPHSLCLYVIYSTVAYFSQRAKGPLNICLFYGCCVQTWDKLSRFCCCRCRCCIFICLWAQSCQNPQTQSSYLSASLCPLHTTDCADTVWALHLQLKRSKWGTGR